MIKLIKPSFWKSKTWLSYLLFPLSQIYLLGFLIKRFFSNPYKSRTKIICIGSPVIGGSGKTPTAIAIYKLLQSSNKKICFLSKGYKASIKKPTKVTSLHTAFEVGDEALLFANYDDSYIAYNRLDGIKFLENSYDIIIIDDGMQNFSFHKDINIIVKDSYSNSTNNFLLPAGPLRESMISCLKRCNFIINIDCANLDTNIMQYKANARLTTKPNNNSKYIAFSGIAHPEKFFNSLINSNFNLINTHPFPDHYNFTKIDLDLLIKEASKANSILVTTSKDYVRLPDHYKKLIQCINLELEINNSEDLINYINQLITI